MVSFQSGCDPINIDFPKLFCYFNGVIGIILMDRTFKYYILPFGISLIAVIIYLVTAAPSMLWEDAFNFVDASVHLDVNLPPAPLYVLIGHFFTLLPFGSDIFRLQLFSAISAATSLFLLYRIIIWIGEQVIDNKTDPSKIRLITVSGIFGTLSLAFSYEYWSQAQNTDKYTFEVCLGLIILYLLTISIKTSRKIFQLFLAATFIFGLATGTDPVIFSFLPSIILVFWYNRKILNAKRLTLLMLTFLAGIILVYSYVPLMAQRNAFLNYGDAGLWTIATGLKQNSNQNGFTGSLQTSLNSAWNFFYMLEIDFTPFILPFIILGGWYLLTRRKDMFFLFISIIVTNFLLSVLYLSGNQDSWYLISDVGFAIFAGIGLLWLGQKLSHEWLLLIIFLISFSPLIYWWSSLDRHKWEIADDYMYNLYKPIQEPAIVLGAGDLFINETDYIHDDSNYKPDIIPVYNFFYSEYNYTQNLQKVTNLQMPVVTNYYPPDADNYSRFVNDFIALNIAKYNIYMDYPMLNIDIPGILSTPDGTASFKLDNTRYKLVPAGLVYKVVPLENNQQPDLQDFNFQSSNNFPINKPVLEEQIYNNQLNDLITEYAFAYITAGNYEAYVGNTKLSMTYYQKGYALDPNNEAILNTLETYYAKVISSTPTGSQLNQQATALLNKIESNSGQK